MQCKCYYQKKQKNKKQKKLSQFLLLTVNISHQGRFSVLNSIVAIQGPPQVLKSSLQGTQWQVSLLFDKKKKTENTTCCHSTSFVVTHCYWLPFVADCCPTHRHSLYHSLSFVVTCSHLLSLFVTQCMYKKPYFLFPNVLKKQFFPKNCTGI